MKRIHSNMCISFLMGMVACSDPPPPEVAAAPVLNNTVRGVARVEPQHGIVQLVSSSDGTIVEAYKSEGEWVNKSEVIFQLDDRAERAQWNQARRKAEGQAHVIGNYRAQWKLAASKQKRDTNAYAINRRLFEARVISEETLRESHQQMENSGYEEQAAEAAWREALTRLEELKSEVEYYAARCEQKKVRAPMNGRLVDVGVSVGNYVDFCGSIAVGGRV